MARQLLKDVHPICAAIINGDHDDILDAIAQSVKHRNNLKRHESGIRVGAVVQFTDDPKVSDLTGQHGVVTKVNPKSISVAILLDEGIALDAASSNALDIPLPTEWRLSPGFVMVVEPTDSLTSRARETRKVIAYWNRKD